MPPASPQSASHGTSSTSLKRRLLTPFLVCIVLLTVVVAVLVHQAGQRVIGDSMDTVLTQKVANITQAIQRHLLGSVAALEVAAPLGLSFSSDISQQLPALQERFWTATSLHSRPYDYVYFGNEAGQSFGMKRLESDLAEMRVSLSPQEPRRLFHISKIDGKPVYEGSDTRPFDPRTRPWYVAGSTTSVPVWSSVYVDFSRRDLVMTRSRRVLDENNRLIGVIAADVSLRSLNTFVVDLDLTPQARAVIVEPDGSLVAASNGPHLKRQPNGSVVRINLLEAQDDWTRSAIRQRLTTATQLPSNGATRVETLKAPDGESLRVAYRRIVDDAGLDWLIFVVVPNSELRGNVVQITLGALALGVLALLGALLMGTRALSRVARDISDLSFALRALGEGQLVSLPQRERRDEIGELARSFDAMQKALFTDRLTGLFNRNALIPFLESRIAAAGAHTPPANFAVIFVDLNRFKPINDLHGHENGDRALREVGERIREQLRDIDFAARLGGDEFVVVQHEPTNLAQVEELMERLKQAIIQPLTSLHDLPADVRVNVGAALGAALYPLDGENVSQLLQIADQRMYLNKTRDR